MNDYVLQEEGMKTAIIAIIFFAIFSAGSSEAEDVIKEGDLLGLERCIEIALMKHPNILAATYTVSVNQSRVGQANADYYPQIDLNAGYSKTSPVTGGSSDSSRVSSGSGNSFDQYTSRVSLRQNIYDFGKTSSQVSIQRLNLGSARSDLENVKEQTVLNVRQAYYAVLKAKKDRVVAEETVKQFEMHLEQARGFYEVGARPKFDVTKAEVDLSNARLNLIQTVNSLRVSFATLNNSIGLPEAPEYDIVDNLAFQQYEITIDEALRRAYMNRPDLASLALRRQASEKSIELAKTGYYPALTGNASYNWAAEKFPLDEGWDAGVELSFPLFSGFLTTHQVAEAKASLNAVAANEEFLRQNISLEVRQAYLNLKNAEERIPAAELTVRQAEENLELANGRYSAGVGNPIEVTDAQVGLTSAKTAYIQALYDYKISLASLEKAMGETR
ncbi:MAG: TolC family protein [Nitrospiraceae bacterium]|nr:MAG: TolC family protein [Nitrospiraceae bacterium]